MNYFFKDPENIEPSNRDHIDCTMGEVVLPSGSMSFAYELEITERLVKYSSPWGDQELRQMFLTHVGACELTESNVFVTMGGKEALWFAFQLFVKPGDTVLLPIPYWPPYMHWVNLLGGKAIFYEVKGPNHTSQLLDSICNKQPDVVVLNSPHNPTGISIEKSVTVELVNLIENSATRIIVDQVYAGIDSQDYFLTSLLLMMSDWQRVCVVDSVSKRFAAAGLRVGFLISSQENISKALKFRALSSSCLPPITQCLAKHLLGNQSGLERLHQVRDFVGESRHSLVDALINAGAEVISSGTLYVWLRGTMHSIKLRENILIGEPGDRYGLPGHFRLCATGNPRLQTVLHAHRSSSES
ncbi:pyridoxal phosphate-dependent aminotransferase [Methylomicrobium lacus]|uniref:pyridoxal phosphate-dependent aminotransferase n=1 Tax=Methylomicrobium lacus TaxID=136992 RepID=UPI0035A87C75